MRSVIVIIIPCMLLIGAFNRCGFKYPASVPVGRWAYTLYLNDIEAGSANLSNLIVNDSYVSTMELHMGIGDTVNISRQTVTETLDFRPISFDSRTVSKSGRESVAVDIHAAISGNTVLITDGRSKTRITIDREFFLEGQALFKRCMDAGWKAGSVIRQDVYNPAIDPEGPLAMTMTIAGPESIMVDGIPATLMHILESVPNVKRVDRYIDELGVTVKLVIQMLNTEIVLVKI